MIKSKIHNHPLPFNRAKSRDPGYELTHSGLSEFGEAGGFESRGSVSTRDNLEYFRKFILAK